MFIEKLIKETAKVKAFNVDMTINMVNRVRDIKRQEGKVAKGTVKDTKNNAKIVKDYIKK